MPRSYSAISLILYAVMLPSVAGDQCPYMECTCTGPNIYCDSTELSKLQLSSNQNNSGFLTLTVDNNQITNIPSGSLPPSLTQISFTHNPLSSIDDKAFDESAGTLSSLTLSGVNFSRIPDAFSHLKALKDLSVYDGDVQDWNEDAMKNIGQTLDTLYLSNIGLKSWPMWIQYCTNLTSLSVLDSFIAFIPDGAMDNLANSLVYLYLSNNILTAVPKAISNFTALQEIDFGKNKISDVSWLPRSSKLQQLILSTNNISDFTSLSNALRPYAESMTSLNLLENSLTVFPILDFLTKLGYLDFTSNKISDAGSGSIAPSVNSINLAYNLLPYIPHFMSELTWQMDLILPYNSIIKIQDVDFPPHTDLVELAYNSITELTDTSFPQNSTIIYLHLDYNPIVAISLLAFRNLPHLVELNLSNTKLERIPLGLTFLKGLIEFAIIGNTNLVCTCQEKSVQSTILSMSASNVEGVCGRISVYSFFATFSPSCPEQ